MASLRGVPRKCERCLTYSPFPITCAPLGRSGPRCVFYAFLPIWLFALFRDHANSFPVRLRKLPCSVSREFARMPRKTLEEFPGTWPRMDYFPVNSLTSRELAFWRRVRSRLAPPPLKYLISLVYPYLGQDSEWSRLSAALRPEADLRADPDTQPPNFDPFRDSCRCVQKFARPDHRVNRPHQAARSYIAAYTAVRDPPHPRAGGSLDVITDSLQEVLRDTLRAAFGNIREAQQ
jgi:hypothetical protein